MQDGNRLLHKFVTSVRLAVLAAGCALVAGPAYGITPVIPGTGTKLDEVGDDFENPSWAYNFQNPKSTRDLDGQDRQPGGEATNGRWYEGMKRGHPDVIQRVTTPQGGLPGSQGALSLRSLFTGVPGRPSGQMQQDDFIADVNYRLSGPISATRSPSAVTRVFLPPVDSWEDRTGPQFAFRLALQTTVVKEQGTLLFSSRRAEGETYWVGMFLDFESKTDGREHDYASLRIRADESGGDFLGKQITTTGWWTLGMSVSPDGAVHYYASPGVDDLTEDDYITSQFPYGYRCEGFKTFFFNVCNGDDGQHWSTEWIIDDPSVYVLR